MQKTQVAPPPFSMPPAAPGSARETQHALTLPAGTRLGEFEVTQMIGEGGFGLVYLAWDHSLQRKVALKEYMPSSIAARVGESEIRPRSARHQETFEAGLKSFINEARLLAQFDHPSLLKVYRFWEANGTAYMVMPFLEGATLRDTVRNLPEPPDEAWILTLLAPLFDALNMLHSAQIYHRDIAPDNVLLMADTGRPLLLDFGAARRVIGDMTQALTAILKPGYAPVEQYAEVPGMKQGPWTDVYALAAVVHWMILGKTPSPSVGRMFDDAQVSVTEKAAGRYSPRFLGAIDRALAVLPDNRTQTIDDFRRDLSGDDSGEESAGAAPALASTMGGAAGVDGARTKPGARFDDGTRDHATTARTEARTVAAASSGPTLKRRVPLVAAILAIIGAAVAAAFVLWPRSKVPAEQAPAAATAAAPQLASSQPPPPVSTPATTPAAIAPVVEAGSPAAAAAVPATTTATASAVAAAQRPPEVAPAIPPAEVTPSRRTRATREAREAREAAAPARAARRDESPVEPRERAATPTLERARSAEPKAADDTRAECGRLFQRLSLGDADQALMDRIRTLRCR